MNGKVKVIYGGTVVTEGKKSSFIENGAVAYNDKEILDVGTREAITAIYPDAELLDARGGYITPSFINPHEHCYSSMVRGMTMTKYAPTNFMENLTQKWWNLDKALTEEQIRIGTQAFLIDAAKNGVTTEFEHNASFGCIEGSLSMIEEAAEKVGIRICPCFEVSDRWGQDVAKRTVDENIRWMKSCDEKKSDQFASTLGLHASFTLSDQTFAYIREKYPLDRGCHIHIAEALYDEEDSLEKYGMRITQRLDSMGLLNEKTIIAHGVYLSDDEMDLIKERDAMVVNNPESNMNNAVGCPPTHKLIEKEIVTGLGMDGFTHDMFLSWRIASALYKHQSQDINAAWTDLPQMVWRGNAEIGSRYFNRKMGCLEKGAVPDMMVLHYDSPTPVTKDNFNSHMLFGMNGSNIYMTICGGQLIAKEGHCLTMDEEKILYESRQQAEKLWKQF